MLYDELELISHFPHHPLISMTYFPEEFWALFVFLGGGWDGEGWLFAFFFFLNNKWSDRSSKMISTDIKQFPDGFNLKSCLRQMMLIIKKNQIGQDCSRDSFHIQIIFWLLTFILFTPNRQNYHQEDGTFPFLTTQYAPLHQGEKWWKLFKQTKK